MITPDRYAPSPNINDAPMPAGVKCVIIHSTRSGVSMNHSEFEGTLNYMARPGTTSSHWVISRGGLRARVVEDWDQAWHAGADNDNAWGIELEQGVEADGFTPEQIASLIEVCKGYMDDFGVPPVHTTQAAMQGFIGHEETAQGKSFGKSDPGNLFPWGEFIAGLTAEPTPIVSAVDVYPDALPVFGVHFAGEGPVTINPGDVWWLVPSGSVTEADHITYRIQPPTA